jgi:hypothetical protein
MDVKALLEGCLVREREAPDEAVRVRMLAIVRAGLEPPEGSRAPHRAEN